MDEDPLLASDAEEDDGLFPASEDVPGQSESRSAYARFAQWAEPAPPAALPAGDGSLADWPKCDWLDEYRKLRAEGWDWRKAAYIAWAATPTNKRWPIGQHDLALQVLGLRSDRTIRKWREQDPRIDERVGRLQTESLFSHRGNVLSALTTVASMPDPKANPDRRMFLEMTGDYKPKGQVALSNPDGSPMLGGDGYLNTLSDEELESVIRNLEKVAGKDEDQEAASEPG
jgi:hypothetical protein